MAVTRTNSVINLNLPSSLSESFQDLEVRALADVVTTSLNNFLREFERFVQATQKDITLWPSLVPSDTLLRHQLGRFYAVAGEALAFGDLINLYNNGGVINLRKCNGASGLVKPAHGYCSTANGVAIGAIGEYILSQGLLTISGILPGQAIYLSTSPGQATATPLTGAGQLEQFIGIGVASNIAYIDISLGQYIQH